LRNLMELTILLARRARTRHIPAVRRLELLQFQAQALLTDSIPAQEGAPRLFPPRSRAAHRGEVKLALVPRPGQIPHHPAFPNRSCHNWEDWVAAEVADSAVPGWEGCPAAIRWGA
jgi:hypothetical protein